MTTTTTPKRVRKPRPSRAKPQGVAQRAMLVDLTIRQWTAAKQDRKISDEVAAQHNADRNAGHYYKRLLGKEALDKINRIINSAFNDHYALTLPWLDTGARILSGMAYFKYMEKMRAHKAAFDEAVEEFYINYDGYVEEAKERLNGMFNEDDYPVLADIKRKFEFGTAVFPLPTAGDFRVALSKEEVDRIKSDIEANNGAAMSKAMGDVAERIKVVVERMSERLRAYSGGREGSFRDTLVSNVRDMADLVPALNIADDPRLGEIAKEMADVLCQHEAETLRTDETARNVTADAADAILAKIKDFAF